MAFFIGVDIGTSATKVVLIDSAGKVLAQASSSYQCYFPQPMWSEQDPDDWWKATVQAVRETVQQAGVDGNDVAAIGLSGQMHGAVFLDENNNIIRRAILWNDQRTTAECRDIEEALGGRDKLLVIAANPALTGFTAPKILWLRKHEPKNFDRVRKVLLPKDDVRRRLTGEFATDVSDASGMLLLDVKRRCWSDEILSRLQLPKEMFAKVYESDEVTGTLTKAAAEELGLNTSCVVVAGAGDCAAAAVGTGIVSSGKLVATIGTSGVLAAHSEQPAVDPKGRMNTICHAVRDNWFLMGVNLSGGGCMQWFKNNLCTDSGSNILQTLDSEAKSVAHGSDGLFFLPYLSGERTPHADDDARACFIGMTLAHGRGHMARAIMEGVGFNLKQTFEIMRELGVATDEIRINGGGARSAIWRQILADMFGTPIRTLESEEGPAYGAALLAAVGAQNFRTVPEACEATIKVAGKTNPSSEAQTYYNKAYPTFRELYFSLRHHFKDIAKLGAGQVGALQVN